MNDFFEKNIKYIEENRPELWENLKGALQFFRENPEGTDNEKFELRCETGKLSNLYYKRSAPAFEGLYHGDDPSSETKNLFQKADLTHPHFVLFLGQGLGHLLYWFYHDRPVHNFSIFVVEKNPQIFLRSLCVYDFTKVLQDDSVCIVVGQVQRYVVLWLNLWLQKYSTVERHLKLLVCPTALQTELEYYENIIKIIISTRDHSLLSMGNSVEDCFIGFENTANNAVRGIGNTGLEFLRRKFDTKTIVSVAAGPATEEHWDRLRSIQGKIPILTCDCMLKAMIRNGIEPDIVTAVERVDLVTEYFSNVEIPERTLLIGPLLLMPGTFEVFHRDQYLYCSTQQQGAGMGLDFLGSFFPGGSAGNLSLYLAATFGFENIIMVGHNLAFHHEKRISHIKGTGIKSQDLPIDPEVMAQHPKVISQDESMMVPTQLFWNTFRHQIEDLISMNADKTWINTAPKGAKIEGAKLMSFDEALAEYGSRTTDFFKKRKQLEPKLSDEELQQRSRLVYSKTKLAIASLEKRLQEAEKITKKIKQWREEVRLKEIEGKQVSLDYLNKRIDEALKIKVDAVNKDPYFHKFAISTLLPAHVTLERQLNEMPSKYDDNYKLKRDFLLAHEHYFELWNTWLPKLISALSKTEQDIKRDYGAFLQGIDDEISTQATQG